MRSLLPITLSLLSCFSEPQTPQVRCDDSHLCASGTCRDGLCVDSVDNVDAAVSDGLSPPDALTPNGCVAMGAQVGKAFCCTGSFTAGQARAKCASGYEPCKQATSVDLVACGKLAGFCVAEVPAHDFGGGGPITCGVDPGTANRDWAGCGKKATYSQAGSCGGFSQVLRCQPGSDWDCFGGHALDKTIYTSTADGVLCCPIGG